jgi:hypothetical protein
MNVMVSLIAATALAVEGNAGPALLADERLRVFGDAFQQLDVSLFSRRGLR